jgi:hypothetical protein
MLNLPAQDRLFDPLTVTISALQKGRAEYPEPTYI